MPSKYGVHKRGSTENKENKKDVKLFSFTSNISERESNIIDIDPSFPKFPVTYVSKNNPDSRPTTSHVQNSNPERENFRTELCTTDRREKSVCIVPTANSLSKTCRFCWCSCCCNCSSKQNKDVQQMILPKHHLGNVILGKNDHLPNLPEIQSWGESFEKLMKNSVGRMLFREFLKSEYSEENFLFWMACEELKKEVDLLVIEEKAKLIYEDYISILSPTEVSLDSKVKDVINKNMIQPTIHAFDEAQFQIYTLMQRDSYPRFVNSPIYKTVAQIPQKKDPRKNYEHR